jgi:hypothetical protein
LVAGSQTLAPSLQDDFPRSDNLADAEWAEQFNEGINFVGTASDLNGHGVGADIYDGCPEDFHELNDMGTLLQFAVDFNESQFPLNNIFARVVLNFDDINQFVQLLGDLLNGVIIATNNDGHARCFRVVGGADGEALNVVAPSREQASNPRQNSRSVFNQNGKGMQTVTLSAPILRCHCPQIPPCAFGFFSECKNHFSTTCAISSQTLWREFLRASLTKEVNSEWLSERALNL